jgi:hypothetical protein
MRSLGRSSRIWCILIVVIYLEKVAAAFHHSKRGTDENYRTTFHRRNSLHSSVLTTTRLQILWDPHDVETRSDLVDFPTSAQQTELKKEAKRRMARKEMPLFIFKEDEMNGPWSPETFQEVWNLLTRHEMITLKGICRNDRKLVYQTAQLFCEQMEDLISASQVVGDIGQVNNDDCDYDDDDSENTTLPVAVLSYKGHSALIYCPTLPLDNPDKFHLRTSVGQKNVWTARPKPLRDDRGQIIKQPMEVLEE